MALLRFATLVTAVSGLLIFSSVLAGRVADTVIVIENIEVEGSIYLRNIKDVTHNMRIALAGTRCFGTIPDWVYPGEQAIPPPIPDAGRLTMERIKDVTEVLDRCHP